MFWELNQMIDMLQNKKELQIAALQNGTVIDHIPSEQLFKVVSLLEIEKLKTPVTIGYHLDSKKMGSKGILKISGKFFVQDEINRIALIAPSVKLNIIRDYEVVEKKYVQLPDELTGIVKCNNPKCITNNEPMKTRFNVIEKENVTIKCEYCELKIRKEDIVLL
jgi:aspartate carbamoyltransferase regulatory subunit